MAEFDQKGGGLNHFQTRDLFLSLLEEEAPDAITDLVNKVFKFYKDKPEKNFYVCFKMWGQKYHLESAWLFEHIIRVFDFWRDYPSFIGKHLVWGNIPTYWVISDETKIDAETDFGFKFEFPAWQFNQINESEYSYHIQKAFKQSLDDYLEKASKFAESQGYKRNKKKRKRDGRNPEIRMRCFIRYQVKGESLEDILRSLKSKNSMERSALQQQFNPIVTELNLKLRIS